MPFLLWINPLGAGASIGFVRILITAHVCLSNYVSALELTDSSSAEAKQQIQCSHTEKKLWELPTLGCSGAETPSGAPQETTHLSKSDLVS